MEVKDESWQIVDESTKLRRIYGLRTPDAIQLATAKIFKADLFITNDKIFNKVRDFKVIQINS